MSVEIRAAPAALAVSASAAGRHARAVFLLLIAALVLPAASGRADPTVQLDLASALTLARKNNPGLEVARRKVGEARGDVSQASVLLVENPELDLGIGPRFLDNPGMGRSLALDLGLSQKFEIAGQRGHRIDRASNELAATEAETEAAGRALDLAVATGFFRALAATERARIAGEHEALARELFTISKARFDRGATSPLEANGARVRLAEATRQLLKARGEESATRVRLVTLLGLSGELQPALIGSLPARPATRTADLTAAAQERRPEIAAAVRRAQAARAASELAGASAWPDVRIGARYATEESSTALVGTLSVPLPFFQRNQGERERTQAAAERLDAEERAAREEVMAQVREAGVDLERAAGTLALYDEEVLRSLEENVGLLKRMLEAGKVAPSEVIVLQRELLEGRVGYLEARAELAIADARARTAAGFSITETVTGGGR